MRARGRPGLSVGRAAEDLAVVELDVTEGVEEAGAELARHSPRFALQVDAPPPDGRGWEEEAALAPSRSGAHAEPSVKSALQVCGGGVHGSGSSQDAAPLSARRAPAARQTGAMAPVAKKTPRGTES